MPQFKIYFSFKFSLILYLIFSFFYGSPSPLKWSPTDSFLCWSVLICIPGAILVSVLIAKKKIDLEKGINNYFDLSAYKEKQLKTIDCITGHYTNVATIGLFMMLIVYILRPFISDINGFLAGAIVAALFMSALFLYSLFVLRLALYLTNESWFFSTLKLLLIIYIDMQAINLFIVSVPKT